ncbi:phosphoglycerate mutase [Candidatus Moduliflexus flocculans]|uniref:Phosphoglycerate mutase n=1 Tax=Candidatus Moduliflexus flocculans TaxID=1499966 RepID=A0A081BRZ6_9BACT|nr:phosphoglycerate mutase [Candidatus Moduliflexus flocculans]
MSSTTILLIRHGETAWNRGHIFRGLSDIPLNEQGRTQARLLAQALLSRQIDAAYSSPLSRAMETASIAFALRGLTVAAHDGLRDFDYGRWTGLEECEVARQWPDEDAQWRVAPHEMRPPEGETLREAFHRAWEALAALTARHQGQTVAIVAHRVINKVLVSGLLTLGLERCPFIRQDNCCLNEFERAERGDIVISLNDTSHLRQSRTECLTSDF